MANPIRGEVSLSDGETSYTLVFSVNAIVTLEDAMGKTINEIAGILANPATVRMRDLRSMFWAAASDHHPGLSEDDAGRIMQACGAKESGLAIGRAFALAFPPAEDKKPPSPKAGRAGTGKAS